MRKLLLGVMTESWDTTVTKSIELIKIVNIFLHALVGECLNRIIILTF